MREIRFRAWSTLNKPGMVYMDPIKSPDGILDDLVSSDQWVVMQYTGLKDKNGKEIYEGDILKMDSEEDQSTFEVVWKFNGWRKKFADWPDDLPEYNLLSRGDLGFYKIIGNVYKNPELLERP